MATYSGGQSMPAAGTSAYKAAAAGPITTQTNAISKSLGTGGAVTNSSTGVNPHDLPSYNPATDPMSSAYNANAPTTPDVPAVVPTKPIVPETTPATPTTPLAQPQATGTKLPFDQAYKALQAQGLSQSDFAMASDSLKHAYGQAATLAKDSGVQAPQDAGGGMAGVSQFNNAVQGPKPESPSIIGGLMETDKNFDSIFTGLDEFMSPMKQKTSLVDEYKALSQSLGIQEINTELINTKKIIEGTEDDIRNEVTATGGFATDSQVLALANARNKSLVKNYNALLETRDNATQQLNTMMQLTIQDRNAASAEFDRKLNYGFKVLEYRDKFQQNAREGLNNIVKVAGYKGLLASLGGNAYDIGLAEKTLGLGAGGLQNLASLPPSEEDALNLENKRLQNQKLRQDINGTSGGIPTVKSINGVDKQWNPTTGKWEDIDSGGTAGGLRSAQAEENINLIDGLVKDGAIRSAVGPTILGRFVGRGLDSATGARQNYIAGVEQLRSQLTLDSLVQAKAKGATFGALSEGELKTLSASATKLGSWAKKDKDGNVTAYATSEKEFKKELEKISNFAKLDYILKGGDAASVGVQIINGVPVVKNSDGTYTELQ